MDLRLGDLVTDAEGRYGIVFRIADRGISVLMSNVGHRALYHELSLMPVKRPYPSEENVNFASMIPWVLVG